MPTLKWFLIGLCLLNTNGEVHQLDETNFDESTSTGLWYLEFYAPWCGHCKKFAPIYEEASKDPDLAKISFGAIDATAQKQLAKRFGVSRFPTIKFWQDNVEYRFTGTRELESLKKYGLQMLEPVIKDLTMKEFKESNDKYSVSFLHIANNNNENINSKHNYEQYLESATLFRPNVPFFSIDYNEFNTKYIAKRNKFVENTLKLDISTLSNEYNENSNSKIYSITPSLKNDIYSEFKFNSDNIRKFIQLNRYPPIIQLKLGNYKELLDNCKYFGIIFINADDTHQNDKIASDKMINEAEQLVINNPSWNVDSIKQYQLLETSETQTDDDIVDDDNKQFMYEMMISWCNYTEYNEWVQHTFGINKEELPLFVIYTPIQDGYWRGDMKDINSDNNKMNMITFINNVLNDKLEITYTRNWFARQAIKLEKWLNGLSGWQIALVFISIFVFLCAVMIGLDWCCSPSPPSIKDD